MMTWRKRVMAYVLSAAMLISSTPMNAFGMEILSDDSEEILVLNEGADDLLVIDDDGEEVLALEDGLDFEEAEDDFIIEDLIEDEDPWMGEGVAGELIDPMETEFESEVETEVEDETEMTEAETEVGPEAEMTEAETEAVTEAETQMPEAETEAEEELLIFEEVIEEAGQELASDGEETGDDVQENTYHYDLPEEGRVAVNEPFWLGETLNYTVDNTEGTFTTMITDVAAKLQTWVATDGDNGYWVDYVIPEDESNPVTVTKVEGSEGEETGWSIKSSMSGLLWIDVTYITDENDVLTETDTNGNAVHGFGVGVQDEYYYTTPFRWDLPDNVKIGETLTFKPELHYVLGNAETESGFSDTVMDAVFEVEFPEEDNNWDWQQDVDNTMTFQRKNGGKTSFAVIAKVGGEEVWRRNYHFDGYNTEVHINPLAYGSLEDGGLIFTGTPQVITVNTANLEEAFANYAHMDWQVTWDGDDKCDSCVTQTVSEDTETLTLQANGCHVYRDVCVVALAKAVEDGGEYNLIGREMYFHIVENEVNINGLPGENEYRPMLQNWELYINKNTGGWAKTAATPQGGEMQVTIQSVVLTVDEKCEDKNCFALDEWKDGQGWTIRANNWGVAEVQVEYTLKDGTEGVRTFNVGYEGEVWDMWIDSDTHTDQLLPNSSLNLNAGVRVECYTQEDGHFRGETEDVWVEWSYGEGAEEVVTLEPSEEDSFWATVTARADMGGRNAQIRAAAYVPDEEAVDGKREVAVRDFWVYVNNGYHHVEHVDIETIPVGESVTILAELTYYDLNGLNDGETVEDARFRWEWDSNAVSIKSADGREVASKEYYEAQAFTIKKLKNWSDNNVKLVAERNTAGENETEYWEYVAERTWNLAEYNYEIRFEDLGDRDHERIYNNHELDISFNTENIAGTDHEVVWQVGPWDEEANDIDTSNSSSYYQVHEEETNVITLHGSAIPESGVSVRAIIKAGGEEVSRDDTWVEKRADKYEYDYPGQEPGGNEILPGQGFWIPKEMDCYVENAEHPYGHTVTAIVTDVSDVQYQRWQDSEVDGQDGAWIDAEHNGALHINENDDGWNIWCDMHGRLLITLTHHLKDKPDITGSFEDMEVYVNGDTWYLEKYYPNNTDNMVVNDTMEIDTSLYHSWNHGEDNHGDEEVRDYRLELQINDEGNLCYDTEMVNASIEYSDEGIPYLRVTTNDREGRANIPVVISVRSYDDNGNPRFDKDGEPIYVKVGVRNFWISICGEYHYINPTEVPNVKMGDELDLSAQEFSLWRHTAPAEPEEEDAERVRYSIVGFDPKVWDVKEGTENDPLPVLIRKEGWDTDVTLMAEVNYKEDGEETDDWKEVLRYNFHFGGLDLELRPHVRFGNLGRDGRIFTDYDQAIEIETRNWEEALGDYEIVWTVGQYDETTDSIVPTERVEYEAANGGSVLWLTAQENNAYEWVEVAVSVQKNGIEYAEDRFAFRINEPEINMDLPEGEFWRLIGWGHDFERVSGAHITNSFHPYGDEVEMNITNMELEVTEGAPAAIELNQWEDGNGWKLEVHNWGRAAVHADYLLSDGTKGTHNFDVCVGGELYSVELSSDKGTDHILPGASATLTAEVWGEGYDYENGQHYECDLTGLEVEWSCVEGEDIIESWNVDEHDFTKFHLMVNDEVEEDREICIVARAYLPNDETGEREEVAGSDFRFYVRSGYHQLAGVIVEPMVDDDENPVLDDNGNPMVTYQYAPLTLDTWLEAGEQADVMPALWYFENGSEEPEFVDEVNYRWEWDPKALKITDENGAILNQDSKDGSGTYGAAPFTLERPETWNGWGTNVNLIAELPGDDGDYEEAARCSWYLNEINYETWFENQRDGSLFYDEDAYTVSLNTKNIEPLGYKIVWKVGQMDESDNFIENKMIAAVSGEDDAAVVNYAVDGNEITFNGPNMKAALEELAGNPENTENVDYGFVLLAEIYTDGRKTEAGTQEPTDVRDLGMHIHFDEEYLEDDENDGRVIGQGFKYADANAVYWIRDAEHPLGQEYMVEIRDIQVTNLEGGSSEGIAFEAVFDETENAWYLNAIREGEAKITYTLYNEELGEFTVERIKWVTRSMYRLSLDTDIRRNVLRAGQGLQILEYVDLATAQVDTGDTVTSDVTYEPIDRKDSEGNEVYSVAYHDYKEHLISIDENGWVTVHKNVNWWDNTDVRVEITIPMGEDEDPIVLNQNINLSIEPDYKVVTADPVAVVPGTTIHADEIGAALIHFNEEHPEGVGVEGVEFFFGHEGLEDWLRVPDDGKTLTVSDEVEIAEGENRYTEIQLWAVYETPQGYEEQWWDRWELTVCQPPNFDDVTVGLPLPEEGEVRDFTVWSSNEEGISDGIREDYYMIEVEEGQERYYIFRRNQGSMLQIWTENGEIFRNPQQNWGGAELIGFYEPGTYFVRLVSEVKVPEGGTASLTLRLEGMEYLQFDQTVEGTREPGQNCSYLVELPYDGAFCFLLEHEETDQPLFLYAESLETGKMYGTYTGDISGMDFEAGTYIVQAGDSGEEGKDSDVTSFKLRVRKDLIAAEISLSQNGFIYDGAVKVPEVTVKGEDGTVLKENKDYVVRYCRENSEGVWEETTDLASVGTIAVQINEVPEPTQISEYVGCPEAANMQLYDILPRESVQEITELPVSGEAVEVEIWNTSKTEQIQPGRREDVYQISVTEDVYYIFRRDQETVMQILDADGNVYYNANADSGYTDIVKFNALSDGSAKTYYIRLISNVWLPEEGEEETITLNLWISRPNDFQLGKTEVRRREVHQLDDYLVTLPYDGHYAFVLNHGTAAQKLVLYVEGLNVEFMDYTYGGELSGEFQAGTYIIQVGDLGDGTFSQVSAYDLGVKKDLIDTTITLSADKFVYNAEEQYPEVTVTSTKETDANGNPIVLTEGLDYVVEYLRDREPTDDLVSVGTLVIQIHEKGNKDSEYVGWPQTENETSYNIVCGTHVARAGSDVVKEAATCTETGTMQHVCDICEKTFTSVIPNTGHQPGAWSVEKDSTCMDVGTKVQKCANGCGTTVATQTIASTGHKGGTATCTVQAKCSVCGTGYGSLAAHKSNNTWKTVTPATVSKKGTQTQNCIVCGKATQTQSIDFKATLELPDNLNALSIKKGKTVKCNLTMTSGDGVTSCVSSDSKILKVVSYNKSGAISLKAVKKGSANLTIKLASGMSKTYKVTVTTGTVTTTKVVSSPAALTLEKGKSQSLKATVTPFTSTQKVTYKTSNKKVAKVSSAGKVTAVAPGTAKITLKSGSKSATCTVTVAGIANVKTSLNLKRKKSVTLAPKLYGISDKVIYTSSNPLIAQVDAKGKITAFDKKGTVTITVKAGKYSVKCKVKVK